MTIHSPVRFQEKCSLAFPLLQRIAPMQHKIIGCQCKSYHDTKATQCIIKENIKQGNKKTELQKTYDVKLNKVIIMITLVYS